MTINEEKVGYSDSEVSYSNFKKDDINLLISILGEYGEKLIKLCEKIEDDKQKNSLCKFLSRGVVFIILILILSTKDKSMGPEIPRIFLALTGKSMEPEIPSILSFFVFIIFVAFIINFIVSSLDTRKKIQISKREAQKISSRLEQVIRIASQVQDNLSKSPPNWIIRIELDLRLADAESALEYYQEIVGK
jgi:hypothetical protein